MFSLGSNRFIGHFDCDCFEVQIARLGDNEPQNHTKPCIVTYAKTITSVSYEARTFGINRNTSIEDAHKLCPELHEYHVEEKWNKIDRSKFNKTANEIQQVVRKTIKSKFTTSIPFEIIGNDEFYLNFTNEVKLKMQEYGSDVVLDEIKHQICEQLENEVEISFFLETDNGRLSRKELLKYVQNISADPSCFNEIIELLQAGLYAKEIIDHIKSETSILVSAGISTNKLRAKICGAINKPAAITILPNFGLTQMSKRVNLNEIPGLKGTLGKQIKNDLVDIENMYDLSLVSEPQLVASKFSPMSIKRIQNLSNGLCSSPVIEKQYISNQLSFSKSLANLSIEDNTSFLYLLRNLCHGFIERVNQEINELSHRKPEKSQITIVFENKKAVSIPINPELLVASTTSESREELYNWISKKLETDYYDQFYPFTIVKNINFKITKFI